MTEVQAAKTTNQMDTYQNKNFLHSKDIKVKVEEIL